MNRIKSLLPPISIKTTITCLLWYTVSSITSQLTKLILTRFPYPLFLSQCQFLTGACLAFTFISFTQLFPQVIDVLPDDSVPIDPSRPIFQIALLLKILPLGLFQFAGKYFSLNATSLIPLSTTSSIKALSPLLIVLAYRTVYKVIFPIITYLSLIPLLLGVILIITSDSISNSKKNLLENENNTGLDTKHITGIVYCFVSTIIFAAQNVYGKQLVSWDNSDSTAHNPASLVLNTELTRPGTPLVTDFDEKSNGGSYFNPKKSKQKYVRRRPSIHLPYSTSDLNLNEKRENYTYSPLNNVNYIQTVHDNNSMVNNPFAYLVERFQLDKIPKPDKLTIVLYCSLVGSALSLPPFIMNEMPKIYLQLSNEMPKEGTIHTTSEVITIFVLIFLDSLSHFMQFMLSFHLLGLIPALSYSVASMMKRILIIAVSIVLAIGHTSGGDGQRDNEKWFGKISTEQFLGLGLIAVGLYCYDRWGSRSLKPLRT